ncbi:hypothetical protein BASA81_011798 [Batrachochytrium salamandrivorans]|nr:hypothetical protein BASA81_011798 [Batrachochytrium salamandrivorans]
MLGRTVLCHRSVQWSDCSTTGTVPDMARAAENTRSVRPSDTARSRLSACLTHCLRPSALSSWVAAALSRDHSSRRVLHWTGVRVGMSCSGNDACRAVLLANMARLVVPDRSRRLDRVTGGESRRLKLSATAFADSKN